MYVGMNRGFGARYRVFVRVPHVRGDEPIEIDYATIGALRSPCTWG